MRFIHRRFVIVARLMLVLLLGVTLEGCALFQSDEPSSASKEGWSLWPWGSKAGGDATPYIEYQRTRSHEREPMFTLFARNTNAKKTIVGQMRTTMQTSPGNHKVDSQSFTLAPNEVKQLLVYPARFPLTYEVDATFRD